MDNNVNVTSNILVEHTRVSRMRHLLSVVNFVAILLGTVVTLVLTSYRGSPSQVLTHLYIMLVINIIQVALCVTDYVLKVRFGVYVKWLPYVSYGIGGLWLLTVVGEMASGSSSLQVARTDLLIVAVLQCVVALVSYVIWPRMERKSIDSMIVSNVRNDSKKKAHKSKKFATIYVIVCAAVVFFQFLGLLAYKLPPAPYDLFAESRAVKYTETADGTGYIAESVYTGKSTVLNIPAYYNDKPVVGIAKNALVDNAILDKYKISSITIGTPIERDGETYLESYVTFIESGAIQNDKIESLQLPDSIQRIDSSAVISSSLKTVTYAASADFDINYFNCQSLERVVMSGEKVGNISSLEGMNHNVKIEVGKNIYDNFRQNNMAYINSFKPILDEDEFCVTFFPDCDYYIDSIFAKKGETVRISYKDLRNPEFSEIGLDVDTKAYINNRHELGTKGAKSHSAFRGWYFNSAMTDECEFTENGFVNLTESTELYAKWIDEYTGNLDWGTFAPTDSVKTVYWTDEDVTVLPFVNNRAGFERGIVWYRKGTDNALISSNGISQDIDIVGKWILDDPEIDIEPVAQGHGVVNISQSKDQVNFVYDEDRAVLLKATYVADNNLSNLQYGGRKTAYSYAWRSDKGAVYPATENITLQNVAESGVYTLIVTAQSPFDPAGNETSQSETAVTVTIDRKALNLDDVHVANTEVVYDGLARKIDILGTVPAGLKVTYRYADENDRLINSGASNVGVINAGEYKFTAVYEKSNPSEAANYATAERSATLTIARRPLEFVSWKGDSAAFNANSIVYDGKTHSYTMEFDGAQRNDEVRLVYKNDGSYTNTASNAATYTAIVEGVSNSNYTLDQMNQGDLQKSWTILQKEVTVREWQVDNVGSWTGSSVIYDGKSHGVSATVNGAVNGESVSFTYSKESPFLMSAISAGSYSAEIIGVDDDNYFFNASASDSKFQYNWTIAKKVLTVAYSNDTALIYNGGKHGTTAAISGIIPADLSEFTLASFSLSYDNNAEATVKASGNADSFAIKFDGVNAGIYNVGVTAFSSATEGVFANYTFEKKLSSFTIAPKTLTFGAVSSLVYNGSEQELRLPVEGIIESDLEEAANSLFTDTNAASKYDSASGNFYLTVKGTDVGEYPISSGSTVGNSNYAWTLTERKATINKKEITVRRWMNGNTAYSNPLTYNAASREITVELNGVVSGETVELTLANNEQRNVGEYTATATLDSTRYPNYSFRETSKTWEIIPYQLTFGWQVDGVKQNSGYSRVYNGSSSTVTPVYNPLSSSSGLDEIEPVYGSSKDVTKTDVGNYTVQITELSGKDAANYTIAGNATFGWTITRKPVSVNWASATSFTYNGQYQGPSFSLSGLVGSDSGTVTVSVAGAATVTKALSASSGNVFELTGSNGVAVNAGTYSAAVEGFSNGNYQLNSTGLKTSFVINRKTLHLTGNWTCSKSGDLVYNKEYYTWSTSVDSNDLVKHLNESSNPSITLNIQDAQGMHARGYTSTVLSMVSGNHSENYVLDDANRTHTWTISPKTLDVTWLYNTSVTYTASEIRNTITNKGAVCTNDVVEFTYTNHAKTNAGFYVATAESTNSDYVVSNATKGQSWTITPYTINSISWGVLSYVYDGQIHCPAASYTYNGETLTFMYTGNTAARNAQSEKYSVTAALTSTNYTFAAGINSTAQFTIAPRVLDIVWSGSESVVYDGQSHTLTASWSNVVSGETVPLTYTSTDRSITNVGSKTITVNGTVSNANYIVKDGAVTGKTVTVTPRPASIVWLVDGTELGSSSRNTIVYNGVEHVLTGQVKGNDGTVVHSQTIEGTNVGKYTLDLSAFSPNYTITGTTTQTLTINPQPVNISWTGDASITFDGVSHSRTATVKGKNTNAEVSCRDTTVSGTNVGSYTTAITLNDSNYTLTGATGSTSATLTITHQSVKITWTGSPSVTYDGNSHSLTATVVGAKDGKTVACVGNSVSGINAGTYNTSISLTNANYTLTGATGNARNSLVISKREVTVTWTLDGSKTTSLSPSVTYDGNIHTLGVTIGEGSTTVYTSSIQGVNAGAYKLDAAFNNANYEVNGSLSRTLTINKAVLTIPNDFNFILAVGTDATEAHAKIKAILWDALADKGITVSYRLVSADGSSGMPANSNIESGALSAGTYNIIFESIGGANAANYTSNVSDGKVIGTVQVE